MINQQEIEVKLKITKKGLEPLKGLLAESGAKDLGKFEQTDILLDYLEKGKTFGTYDQALRIRNEKSKGKTKTTFTFKGTPEIDKSGKKTRDEFNAEVDNYKSLMKVLRPIGFEKVIKITKSRHKFKLDGVKVVIDQLKFGNFVELEGEKEDIDKLIKKLKIENLPVETAPYFQLQLDWENKKN